MIPLPTCCISPFNSKAQWQPWKTYLFFRYHFHISLCVCKLIILFFFFHNWIIMIFIFFIVFVTCERIETCIIYYYHYHYDYDCYYMLHTAWDSGSTELIPSFVFFVFLKANTSVIKLNLADNWIGAEGAGYVAEMLRENCYISDLVCVTGYVLNNL